MQTYEQTRYPHDDIQEITNVLHRYCRSMDRVDHALGYSVWDGDGFADFGEIFQGTGRDFIDFACDVHSALISTSHRIANVTINVMGQQAGSEAYVMVDLLGQSDGQYVLRTGRGRYVDEWARRDGRWGIVRRQYILDFVAAQVLDQPLIGRVSRDRRDPSYARLGDALEAVSNA